MKYIVPAIIVLLMVMVFASNNVEAGSYIDPSATYVCTSAPPDIDMTPIPTSPTEPRAHRILFIYLPYVEND